MLKESQPPSDTAGTLQPPQPATEQKTPSPDEVKAAMQQLELFKQKLDEKEAAEKKLNDEKLADKRAKVESAEKEALAKGEYEKASKMLKRDRDEAKKQAEEAKKQLEEMQKFSELYKKQLQSALDAQLSSLSEPELNIVKTMSAWKNDDPIAQMQAIKDYSAVKGTIKTEKINPFHAGVPVVGEEATYADAQKRGDFNSMLAYKSRQLAAAYGYN